MDTDILRLRISVLALGVCLIASQLAMASSSDTGTLTVGVGSGGLCGPAPLISSGYVPLLMKGAYSPTGLTGGKTVTGVIDYDGCSTQAELDVSGFSSNPGSSWLTSITCNGVAKLASASSFTYSGGQAIWQWPGNFGFAMLGIGANTSCTIVHN